ncbi:MAG TPA: DUF5010 domain-containing protein [Chloroflexota bacterium]|nr:DUF5010 domain-containing protein [Chloroflexota bacterium]
MMAAAVAAAFIPCVGATVGANDDGDAVDYLSWARPGPYRAPYVQDFPVESFGANQRVVATYFFYWYDAATYREAQSRRSFDPYPHHPPNLDTISFRDAAWYEKEFRDMLAAGIDIVLPDYWGEPGQYNRRVAPAPELNHFATEGLPPMVTALDRLAADGTPLKIGLFLDTTILNDEDLTEERGKRIFYTTIYDFYSKIPPRHWAAVDSRPLVWLYDAQRVYKFDQSTFECVYDRFPRDFGGLAPFIVREKQWERAKNNGTDALLRTEGMYAWGAAPFGFTSGPEFTIAQVGPGFSNAQFGRSDAIHTDRQGGRYYEDQLREALRSGRQIMAIETWNELGEASGILETMEFGRQYIDLTRRYADRFKAGLPPP